MTSRLLIVPSAGLGTRLGADRPKLLVPVAGRPMIDRVLALFERTVDRAVVIVHPSFVERVRAHLEQRATRPSAIPVDVEVQAHPTGMLDAILLAEPIVRAAAPDEIWIVWCDQVAIHPATIERLAAAMTAHPDAALAMPTVTRREPYIHLRRTGDGRIDAVLQRREGDAMPATGEGDMGLFALSRAAYLDLLPAYSRAAALGTATGERNFLPFIAWVGASTGHARGVVTYPAVDEMESLGVNTPEDLQRVERYLIAGETTVR
jgi:bifunctional UDP-N-acetylglucosamine pyrophosphorylase/glucosamine-1-phosphate N-acetyltransferase